MWSLIQRAVDYVGARMSLSLDPVLTQIVNTVAAIHETASKALQETRDLRKQLEKPPVMVVWGTFGGPLKPRYDGKERAACFSIEAGMTSYASGKSFAHAWSFQIQPQETLRLQRWLLLGEGTVRSIRIGNEMATTVTGVVEGIDGRFGEAAYPVCNVGCIIRFDVQL